jgi:hypothetical protein
MTIFRNADDGHMNVGRNASRSSLVTVSSIVVLSAGTLHPLTPPITRGG